MKRGSQQERTGMYVRKRRNRDRERRECGNCGYCEDCLIIERRLCGRHGRAASLEDMRLALRLGVPLPSNSFEGWALRRRATW